MQKIQFQNNILPSGLKALETKSCTLNDIFQKNFLHGVQNARNILSSLEESIEKSNAYEDKLLRCRASHKHSHDFDDWPWEFDDDFKAKKNNTEPKKTNLQPAPGVNLFESWSTMSIVCLQYQYEELSKRYEELLEAFNAKCATLDAKNLTISRLRERGKVQYAQLAAAHSALLCVGDKYMALRNRRHEQKQRYDKKIEFLKERVREVVTTAESARLHLDHKLTQSMALEPDSEYAMLLSEMKKCNQLYLENLKLKAQLEEYLPSSMKWGK